MFQEQLDEGHLLHTLQIPEVVPEHSFPLLPLSATPFPLVPNGKRFRKASKLKTPFQSVAAGFWTYFSPREGMQPIIMVAPLQGIPSFPVKVKPCRAGHQKCHF